MCCKNLNVPEAVVQRCSVKKVLLQISRNSQENTCVRGSFLIKMQAQPTTLLTLFRMGIFGAAHGWGVGGTKSPPLLKISHIYPTMMKLGTVIPYLKKIQKIYESPDTPLDLCWHQHFYQKSANFVISRNTDTDCILV